MATSPCSIASPWRPAKARPRLSCERAAFEFVRRNDGNETYICNLSDEEAEFADIERRSRELGARLVRDGNEVVISAA